MPARPGELLTVSRALQLLPAFTKDRPTRGVTELATEFGLDKSQVHRLLATLAMHGYTILDPATRRYSLGPALVPLGHLAERSPGLRQRLEPHLEELAATTGESTVVCIPDGFRYRTIAACEGPGMLRYATALGRSYPGHLGATGHAMFAFHATISSADLLNDKTDAETVTALRELHQRVRENGYAITEGEFDARVMAVSAPVRLEESLFGSVSALGPPEYMRRTSNEIVDAVLTTASQIEETLRPATA